jgi:hypothetical protein
MGIGSSYGWSFAIPLMLAVTMLVVVLSIIGSIPPISELWSSLVGSLLSLGAFLAGLVRLRLGAAH